MKALMLKNYWDMQVVDVPRPALTAGHVLIETVATGICGSDIHGYTGENGRRVPGQVMGHETVGRVVEAAGSAGQALMGQAVTFNPLVSCDECTVCRSGVEQHCTRKYVIGVTPDIVAAFAQYVAVPTRNVVVLDPDVPIEYGSLVEPLAVAEHAMRRARVEPGQRVHIAGGGPIGQSCLLRALAWGAGSVSVSETDPQRRRLCETLGATTFDPGAGPVHEQVNTAFEDGVNVAIDAVGISSTIEDCLRVTRIGGIVALVGMGAPEVTLPAYRLSTEERDLVGSFCYSADDFRTAARSLGQTPSAHLQALVSEVVGLDEAAESFHRLGNHDVPAGKVLVRMTEPEGNSPA